MKTFLRSLNDYRGLWKVWLPLLVLTLILPPVVLALPLVERYLIDSVLLPRDVDRLPGAVALYGFAWLLGSGIGMANEVLRTYLRERVSVDLRQRLFTHCESLSIGFSRREHSGRTMSYFVNDAPNVSTMVSTTGFVWLGNFIGIVAGAFLMIQLSWQLALAVMVIPPVVAGLAMIVTRPLRPAARRVQDKAADLNQQLQENLTGMREIIVFGQGRRQGRRFGTTLNDLLGLRMRLVYIDTALGVGQTLLHLAATLVIIGFGGYLFINGRISLGTVLAMRGFLNLVLYPASQLLSLIGGMQKSLAAADRIYSFLDQEPEVQERTGAQMPASTRGGIEFDNVTFGYSADHDVLQDVSFTVLPGETVALVGPSGAGKTTIVNLISRFYDPRDGRVCLDGVDLRDLPIDDLRASISMVFQDTFLFASSIRENIAFGKPDASDDEIIVAAQAANAWEFIEALPDGLDTTVGERGIRLSEGQKQRLSIARALLRDPLILILDEPTSALDARSEHLLQNALDHLMRGRTTFVIAHRLATVQRADRILVLDDGKVAEHGTHVQLLQHGGLYRQLYDLQLLGAGQLERELPVPTHAGVAIFGS